MAQRGADGDVAVGHEQAPFAWVDIRQWSSLRRVGETELTIPGRRSVLRLSGTLGSTVRPWNDRKFKTGRTCDSLARASR